MRLQWFWNATFEGLMGSVGEFLKANPDVTPHSTDWKCVPDSNGKPTWYFTMFYRKG